MGIPNENASFDPDILRPKGGRAASGRGGRAAPPEGGCATTPEGGRGAPAGGVHGYPREGHQKHARKHKTAQTQRSVGVSIKFGSQGRADLVKGCIRTVVGSGPCCYTGLAVKK